MPTLRRLPVLLVAMLLLAAGGQARARLLLLEDPLRSFRPLAEDRRRLEIGSEYFAAESWTGLRHTFRYTGTRGDVLAWSLSLPWLYSSYFNPGETGRDAPRFGAALRLLGAGQGSLRLATELWLPFSDDQFYPLQQGRAFSRATLLAGVDAERFRLGGALAYRWELKGLGEDKPGEGWPDRLSIDLRLASDLRSAWALFLAGGISMSSDAATWTRIGAGVSRRWAEYWRVELMAETTLGNQFDRDLHDYRISFQLSRDLLKPEEPEQDAPEGTPAEESQALEDKPPEEGQAPEDTPAEDDQAPEDRPAEEGQAPEDTPAEDDREPDSSKGTDSAPGL